MDWIRYPTIQFMRFWVDQPTVGAWVQWYFVPDGTPFVPYVGPFRIRDFNHADEVNWNDPGQYGGTLGEVYPVVRTRTTGVAPPFAGTGLIPCGSDDAWHGLATYASDPPLTSDKCGCVPEVTGCINCPNGSTLTHTLYADGMSGGLEPLNGPQELDYVGACTWEGGFKLCTLVPPDPDFTLIEAMFGLNPPWPKVEQLRWRVTVRPNLVQAVIQPLSGGPEVVWSSTGVWDCKTPITCFLPAGTFPKDGPTAVSIDGEITMQVGDIVYDLNAGPVTGPYLLLDGSRVSVTTYASLRNLWSGKPWMNDDGVTFQLPDVRDLIPYFAGRTYGPGDTPGNDGPTLTTDQIPAHSHPVVDPGHAHGPATAGESFHVRLVSGTFAALPAGSGASREALTNVQQTGVSVGNNTTAGLPVDVRQKGFALRAKVYTGVFT